MRDSSPWRLPLVWVIRAWLLAPVRLDQAIAGLPSPLGLIHQSSIRATMLAIANGTLASIAMFLLLLLSDWAPVSRHHPFAVRFRRLADGTFAIYLMHYPLMMMARALNLLRPDAPVLDTVTVTSIVLLLIALSAPLDGVKSVLRHVLAQRRRGSAHVDDAGRAGASMKFTAPIADRLLPSAAGNPRRRRCRAPTE